jgi:hypothetical protein
MRVTSQGEGAERSRGVSRSVAGQKPARAKPDNQVQGRESVGHARARAPRDRHDAGVRAAPRCTQVFHRSVYNRGSRRLDQVETTTPLTGERSLRRKSEVIRSGERGAKVWSRDSASSDRAVTTTSDVGASAEAGSGIVLRDTCLTARSVTDHFGGRRGSDDEVG